MKKMLSKIGTIAAVAFLFMFVALTIADASEYGRRGRSGGGGRYGVSEPAAVVLLGAGLVSLGLYAKRKRGKKK